MPPSGGCGADRIDKKSKADDTANPHERRIGT